MQQVVSSCRTYHGRYKWRPLFQQVVEIGYCFVNGKGRTYLQNYRIVRDHAIRTLRERGFSMVCLAYKNGEDPRKRVFAERFLKPLRVYKVTDDYTYFVRDL